MNIYLSDIVKIDWLYEAVKLYIPKLLKLNGKGYFVIYYTYDFDSKYKGKPIIRVKVKEQEVLSIINEEIYKKIGKYNAQKVAYFQEPFLSDSFIFFKILESACIEYDWIHNQSYREKLVKLFAEYKQIDIKNAKNKIANSFYVQSFSLDGGNTSLKNALSEIFFLNTKPVQGLIMVFDLFDNYYKTKFKHSFCGQILTSFVRALKSPNGGLIPEMADSYMRYFIIGEKAGMNDPNLALAKKYLRADIDVKTIFLETQWYFNNLDNKWRKKIDDGEVSFIENNLYETEDGNKYLLPTDLPFPIKKDDYDSYLKFFLSNGNFKKILLEGYDKNLGDFLNYENCYNYYEDLKKIYAVYVQSSNLRKSKFYYNKINPKHIVIASADKNKSQKEIISILLHEIQHYIQNYEGFSGGGNMFLGELIATIGGESVKKFMFFFQDIIKKHEYITSIFSEEKYKLFNKKIQQFLKNKSTYYIKLGVKYHTLNLSEFVGIGNQFIIDLIMAYLDESKIYPRTRNSTEILLFIEEFYGVGYKNYMIDIKMISDKVQVKINELSDKGWSTADINRLFFSCYETILGELEARYTMDSSIVDEEIRDYFSLYSTEIVKQSDVTVIDNSLLFDADLGFYEDVNTKTIVGAGIEKYDDNKYIMHLPDVYSNSENVLHELGHILYDIVYENTKIFEKKIAFEDKSFAEKGVIKKSEFEELFCNSFVDYIHRLDIDQNLTDDLNEIRKVQNLKEFDNYFDEVLYQNEMKFDIRTLKTMNMFVLQVNHKI